MNSAFLIVDGAKLISSSIQPQHALLINTDGKKIVLREASQGARILVNGQDISGDRELFHNDRYKSSQSHQVHTVFL